MFIDEKDAMAEKKDAEVDETGAMTGEKRAVGDDDREVSDGRGRKDDAFEGPEESSGQIASGESDEGPEPDHAAASPEVEDEVVIEGRVDDPEGDSPKTTKKSHKSKGRRGPSQKEVLERLLEKNEVILQLTKKNVELGTKIKDLENKRLRLAAEFENYRKRTRKEWELLKDQTKAEVLSEVLSVADDFERAFATVEDREDDFVKGIRLIYNNLTSILEGFGLQRMNSLGELFDPNLHMAVATIESRNVEPNHVVEVIQEGYLMGETVVRIAKVVIAK